jgi:aspartyl-tRNA(Asn)/glutamyl-tRNA(Gln) amidotransferase subunit B
MSGYLPTIGIECHVQLKTKTKLFAAVGNDAREAPPNTLISHICLGMPGALPVLNKGAIELAMKAAYALGTKPQKFSSFDRKHYFYPDLPKGYQISQYTQPIIAEGYVDIEDEGKTKRIGITRAHLEEDAGKSTHPEGTDYSLVDLNRAGTPLLEIVSEPDIHSASEAKSYTRELYLLMKYADVSDANLYYGNMRFDINVSVSKDPNKFGNRTETKNINSFRAVEKVVEYEIKRQIDVLEKGGEIQQETRGWDDAKQKTFTQRTKEDAHDYRYFPDPDIPPVVLSDEQIDKSYEEYQKVNFYQIRDELENAGISTSDLRILFNNPEYIDFALEITRNQKAIQYMEDGLAGIYAPMFNWLVNLIPTIIENPVDLNSHLSKIDDMVELSKAQDEGRVVSTVLKEGVKKLFSDDLFNVQDFINTNTIMTDDSEIEAIVTQVLKENEKAAEDVKNGEMKAIGFLVGQVMKASKGKANPGIAQQIIKKQLGV